MSDPTLTDRETFLAAIWYLDQVENILSSLGSTRQAMSVGPPLAVLQDFREEVCERGRAYGVVDDSMSDSDIRNAAHDRWLDNDDSSE